MNKIILILIFVVLTGSECAMANTVRDKIDAIEKTCRDSKQLIEHANAQIKKLKNDRDKLNEIKKQELNNKSKNDKDQTEQE